MRVVDEGAALDVVLRLRDWVSEVSLGALAPEVDVLVATANLFILRQEGSISSETPNELVRGSLNQWLNQQSKTKSE